MRTTVDIDEPILERAKRHAATTGQTLGAVVSKALRSYLTSLAKRDDAPFELIVRGRPDGRFPTSDEIARAEMDDELGSLGMGSRGRRAAS